MKNIYLIKSDSYNLLKVKLDEILHDDYDITKFSLLDTDIHDIIADAQYFGFSDKPRAIIINNTKYYGGKFAYEEESAIIEEFLKNNKDVIIIFICDAITKTKANTKQLISLGAEVIDLSTDTVEDQYKLAEEYSKHLNISVDKKSLDILFKNTSNNLDMVLMELEKYSIVTNTVNEDIINKYGFKIPEEDVFKFTGAVISKNFELAFNLLDEFFNNGMEAFSIVGALSSNFTTMYMVKDAVNHGLSDEEIAKIFGFKSAGRVYYLKKDAKIYTIDNLKDIIISISNLDLKIKTGYNPVYSIKEFLLDL